MPAHRPRTARPLRRSTASTLVVVVLTSTVMLAQAPAQEDAMEVAAPPAAVIAEQASPDEACWQLPSLDGARFDCAAVRPSQLPDAPSKLALHLPKMRLQPPAEVTGDCDDNCPSSTP